MVRSLLCISCVVLVLGMLEQLTDPKNRKCNDKKAKKAPSK
jgi:hypothetical protein